MKQEKIAAMERIIAADYANIAGMVVLKDGECIYENYFGGCTEDSRIHVFSVTKSVVSVLIGIALDKGYIARPKSAGLLPGIRAQAQRKDASAYNAP